MTEKSRSHFSGLEKRMAAVVNEDAWLLVYAWIKVVLRDLK